MEDGRTRVAILGGGMAALTTAFALTEAERCGFGAYDITVHQLGWRLGGKIANGRNAERGQRIEEHGLHVWAGFYDNAFTVMRAVFDALPENTATTFQSITDAFKPQNYCYFTELNFDEALPWPYWFEPDTGADPFPGRESLFAPGALPSLCTTLTRMLCFIEHSHQFYLDHWGGDRSNELTRAGIRAELTREGIDLALKAWIAVDRSITYMERVTRVTMHPLIVVSIHLLEHLHEQYAGQAAPAQLGKIKAQIIKHLTAYRAGLKQTLERPGLSIEARRTAINGDVLVRVVLGILKHDCLERGFEGLDDLDLRTFMEDDLPCPTATQNAILTAGYDYVFGYREGDPKQPRLSACSAVQAVLRLNVAWKGAFFFKAMAGMGDTVCTPFYEVLKARGVKFEFFQKVTRIEPSPDGDRIGKITIEQQAALKAGRTHYDPLVHVNGLGCWPSAPHWDQLQNGERLSQAKVDFESAFGEHQAPPHAIRELLVDRDFDQVVLGISVGALKDICQPLLADPSNPKRAQAWTDMVTKLLTVRTQALQLWANCDTNSLGGLYAQCEYPPGIGPGQGKPPETMGPICTAGRKPFDTYADMSHLLPMEAWPPADRPRSVAYFCSTLPDAAVGDAPAEATDVARQNAQEWMTSWLYNLWPKIGAGAYFDWDKLYAPSGGTGAARLLDQYWRANINPSDRYVLSLPGTLQYRMHQDPAHPKGSGYSNLYLTGDWTKTDDINAGCIEVAAMAGLAAASALSGAPFQIVSVDTLFGLKGRPADAAGTNGTQYRSAPTRAAPGEYVFSAGSLSLPPAPSQGRNAEVYCFAFPASRAQCQDFIDRSHNRAGRPHQFKPLLNCVFLTIVRAPDLAASEPPFSQQGTMAETDIGFWLPVGEFEPGALLPKRVYWMPAYLFVDNAYALVSGREIWGFPKYFATMKLPPGPHAAGPFDVAALAFRKYAPNARARLEPVLSLECNELTYDDISQGPIETLVRLCGNAGLAMAGGLLDQLTRPLLGAVGGIPFPVLYLKQFRSANSPTAACYRELLTGPLRLTKLHSTKLLTGAWQLELNELESLPFISDLGFGTPIDGKLALTTPVGLWAKVDFELGPAIPIRVGLNSSE